MPRIEPAIAPSDEATEILTELKEKMGGIPNIFKIMAHSPAALAFYQAGTQALVDHGELGTALREKIALTIAGVNGCDYCASAHTKIGKGEDISDAELSAALEGKSPDDKTSAALAFAREVALKRGEIKDSDLARVRDAGFSDGQIIEMILCVAFNIFTNYFNTVAQTEVDFPRVKATRSKLDA